MTNILHKKNKWIENISLLEGFYIFFESINWDHDIRFFHSIHPQYHVFILLTEHKNLSL